MEFLLRIYRQTATFPRVETHGLSFQLRRAAVSVVSNLAEGADRRPRKEFGQFLNIAKGSMSEIDTQIEAAFQLGHLSKIQYDEINADLEEIDKMISGSMRSLK